MRILMCWAAGLALFCATSTVALAEAGSEPQTAASAPSDRAGPKWLAALFGGPKKAVQEDAPDAGFDEGWLAAQPAATGDANFTCLATAVYFEARGESLKGQAAVAEVILNRTESPEFPKTICAVVKQSNGRGCQFSYTCDGTADRVREPQAWDRAAKVARAMLDGAGRGLTDGATYFHTQGSRPDWSHRFERTAVIGGHMFYRAPIRTAMN